MNHCFVWRHELPLTRAGKSSSVMEQEGYLEKRSAAFLEERVRIGKALAFHKRREAAARKHWAMDGFVKQVVLAMLKITSGCFEPCVLFLDRESRRRQWPQKSLHEILAIVHTVGETCSEEVQGIMPANAQRTAHNYVTQWRVAQWVYSANVDKGVAMPSCLIVAEFRRFLAEIDVEVLACFYFMISVCVFVIGAAIDPSTAFERQRCASMDSALAFSVWRAIWLLESQRTY